MSTSRDVRRVARPPGMAPIPGGRFSMGSDDFYPEERPRRDVEVAAFWLDLHAVTNAAFGAFIDATGYVTTAEREVAGARGSLVFSQPAAPVDLRGEPVWWSFVPGAAWHAPAGPGSGLAGRLDHPVVHVSHEDAMAYVNWCRKRLPTEAEWERAAHGDAAAAVYAWGNTFLVDGRRMANTWDGSFPWFSRASGGRAGTTPAGSYPPNAFGVYDLIGNVWEWTATFAKLGIAEAIIKGGSFLCADEYCRRYRPAARMAYPAAESASHIGFRCARSPDGYASPV
jgi:sulfatase modifying factor 1